MAFFVEGLVDVAHQLRDQGIQLVCQHASPATAAVQCGQSDQVAMVVTDMGYMPVQREWRRHVNSCLELPANVGVWELQSAKEKMVPVLLVLRLVAEHLDRALVEIEGEVVVPVRRAFSKEARGSRAFREAMNQVREECLVPLDGQAQVEVTSLGLDMGFQQDFDLLEENVDQVLSALDIDKRLVAVRDTTTPIFPLHFVTLFLLPCTCLQRVDAEPRCGGTRGEVNHVC